MNYQLLLVLILLSLSTVANSESLDGQVAVIWGGSKGMGRAVSLELAARGAHTVVIARNPENLESVKTAIEDTGGSIEIFTADITDEQRVRAVIESIVSEHGRIDILVQNVGTGGTQMLDDFDVEKFKRILNINLVSSYTVTALVAPIMKEQQYGRIIFTSSITGPETGIPGWSSLGASKAGIEGFVRSAAIELAPYDITVNTVRPGFMYSGGVRDMDPKIIKMLEKSIPIGRIGEPEEIAHAIAFLASKESSYITGTSIRVDGGLTLPESHFLHVIPRPN